MLFSQGERSISYDPVDVVIAGLHLRWHGVWQRPNHLLSRAARDVPVIVVEEPLASDRDDDVVEHGAVTVVTPHRQGDVADALDARTISTVRRLVGERSPLVWLYTPMMLALADAFPGAPVVFDKMDELSKFAHADARIAPRERVVLERSGVVFAGGRSLWRSVAERTRTARCYPSGVDVEHFARARMLPVHPALARFRSGPVYGYVGVIDERLDLDLIDALAAAAPHATIAQIGPIAKIDASVLPRRENIIYLGKREYDELPALLSGIDVALMPFALNLHTENISPTKTLEYLAAGRPVVSTAVPDVVADYTGVIDIARDAREFIALVGAPRAEDALRARRAAEKVESGRWDAIWPAMRRDLQAAGIVYAAGSAARKKPADFA